MKQCPSCQDFALYDDSSERCPFCNAKLIPYVRQRRTTVHHEQPTVEPTENPHEEAYRDTPPEFETANGNRSVFRGSVVSVASNSRFLSRGVKWANAVFRGEPYQIGNPVYETMIRIEEFDEHRLSATMRNLTFFGDAQGQVDVGDDIQAETKRRGGRYVITSLYINDTEARVRTAAQLSSGAVLGITIGVLLLCFLLIRSIIRFFTTGAIWTMLAALVGGAVGLGLKLITILAPILIMCFIIWLFFRKH